MNTALQSQDWRRNGGAPVSTKHCRRLQKDTKTWGAELGHCDCNMTSLYDDTLEYAFRMTICMSASAAVSEVC